MDQIKLAASEAMQGRPMLDGPLQLTMLAEMPIPTSWSQKKQYAAAIGDVWPIGKPDLKNLLWLAEDALKSVVYRDDAIVCKHHTVKRYSDQPKIVITVEPIRPCPA